MKNTNLETVRRYIKDNWQKSFNEPKGVLSHKFLDPAAAYRGQMWDWDSFFCSLALMDVYDNTYEYTKGCVLNFVKHQRIDGSIPYMIDVSDSKMAALPEELDIRSSATDLNSAKPLLAQMAMLVYRKEKDISFIKEVFPRLEAHIRHWEDTQQKKNGLFVWRSYRGSGTDNHPAIYGRPLNSSAGVELNCFMYLEYKALSEMAEEMGDAEKKKVYDKKATLLSDNINKYMYDPIDGLYYHLDMLSEKPPLASQDISWSVPIKFRTWTCFMPLYANLAPKEYAKKAVEHMMNENEFFSVCGLRTMAKNEPMYNTAEMSNPSNWQGPVWIVSTYIMYKGLLNYGYFDEAKAVSNNLISALAEDIESNGAMHEYYNPETGKSTINKGFMNWNALAGLME